MLGRPPEPYLREFVEEIKGEMIRFRNGEVRPLAHCAGIPLSEEWLPRFGLKKSPEMIAKLKEKEVFYVHELQNRLSDALRGKQPDSTGNKE
jgi:hypothetical protein